MQLQGTEYSVYLDMLRLFAHGTWSDYKSKHKMVLYFFLGFICLIACLAVFLLSVLLCVFFYNGNNGF